MFETPLGPNSELTAHTPVPGAQSDLQPEVINCVQQRTFVQWPREQTDLSKVSIVPVSPNFVRTKTGVEEGEKFNTDMGKLITMWDRMENDEEEWKVEEGVRRGGRRVSKRMSELLDKFEGNVQADKSKTSDVNLSSKIISHTRGRGSDCQSEEKFKSNIPNLKKINVVTKNILECDMTSEVGCDWPAGVTIQNLSTNERRAEGQVDREVEKQVSAVSAVQDKTNYAKSGGIHFE